MVRARETATAIGAATGLEPEALDYVGELALGEPFEEAVARVRRLKQALETRRRAKRPLIVSHGIFIRFFLLDSVLGDGFTPALGEGVWQLGTRNAALSTFSRGKSARRSAPRSPAGLWSAGWSGRGSELKARLGTTRPLSGPSRVIAAAAAGQERQGPSHRSRDRDRAVRPAGSPPAPPGRDDEYNADGERVSCSWGQDPCAHDRDTEPDSREQHDRARKVISRPRSSVRAS